MLEIKINEDQVEEILLEKIRDLGINEIFRPSRKIECHLYSFQNFRCVNVFLLITFGKKGAILKRADEL